MIELAFIGGYKVIAEEIKIENSRFDLLLSSGLEKIYLEIKTCTLFGSQVAMFPDAITARGKKHLILLKNLANKGFMTSMLFVVMNPKVEFFLPAYHIDYAFSKTFMDVKDIVDIRAIALYWDNSLNYVESVKQLNIPYSFLEKALKDRGVYILVSHLNRSELINIGKLRKMQFPSGYYIYVGKAQNGMFKRIRRHKGRLKKIH